MQRESEVAAGKVATTPRWVVLATFASACFAAAPVRAATLCVSTSSELEGALIVAELNGENDEIRLRAGTYLAPAPLGFEYLPDDCTQDDCDLGLSGGWSAGCSRRSGHATDTVLTGGYVRPIFYLAVPENPIDITKLGVSLLTVAASDSSVAPGAMSFAAAGAAQGPFVTVDRVIFRDNIGVALAVRTGSPLVLVGSQFDHNVIDSSNAAAAVIETGSNFVRILNNTFTGNTVSGLGLVSGLRFVTSHPTNNNIVNNIFWGNDNLDVQVTDGTQPFSYNDYAGVSGSFVGTNNLQVDPKFVDGAHRDFRLRFDSPLRDNGDGTSDHLPMVDLLRVPRPQNVKWDRGAYEFLPPLFADGFESGSTSAWSAVVP